MTAHPAYPSNSCLKEESLAEALISEQETADASFRRALALFAATFDALHFPLGSPVKGFDLADINSTIADWMTSREDYEDIANELAREAA